MSRRTKGRPRPAAPTPLLVKVVGRTAGVLAILGFADLIVMIVLLAVAGAGDGNSVADTPIGQVSLGVLLPVFAGAIVVSLLLALLNAIGVRPWFDAATGRYVRPRSGQEWAIKLGGLIAGLTIPITLIVVGVGIAVLSASGADLDESGGVLIVILIGGLGGAIGVGAIAGGIVVIGWIGIVAGLLMGAGVIGVVAGQTAGEPLVLVLGLLAIGLSGASYYAGARWRGTIPASVGSFAAGGGYLLLSVAFLVLAGVTHDLLLLVGGVCGAAATVGYLAGGLLGHRRLSASAERWPATRD